MVIRPVKHKFLSTRLVITLISVIFILTGLAMMASIVFFLTSLDHLAASDRAQRVDIALDVENHYMLSILEEYAFWDEAYERIFVAQDETWLEGNSGQYLLDRYQFDFSLAIGPNLQKAYLITNEELEKLEYDRLLSSGLNDLIAADLQLDDETRGSASGYIQYGEDLFIVFLESLRDEISEEIRPGMYLAVGRRLDQEYIEYLQSRYRLPGLHLTNLDEQSDHSKLLVDATGKELGFLAWTLQKPSRIMVPRIVGVTVLFFGLAAFLSRYLMRREYSDRIDYEKRLYEEATIDPLTKISNRRYFMAVGRQAMAMHKRMNRMFTVILFDIDDFKTINDIHGHSVGDAAIIHCSTICAQVLRESDIFGRIGGDEFAIILPETPLKMAEEVANRIKQMVAATPLVTDRLTISMTVSLGVTQMNGQEIFEKMLEQADKAMYKAKKEGRNQVCVYAH
jgi:diguanylate cyclase (GGDEF)-like protein